MQCCFFVKWPMNLIKRSVNLLILTFILLSLIELYELESYGYIICRNDVIASIELTSAGYEKATN
nr:MAG TPA: hypothetical protein [Caudoviricetes sp.]